MSGLQERMLEGVRGLLEQAGDGQLLKAMRLIESLDERGSLDDAVARVRPRLAVLRPIRAIGLRRLLTLPFEDLLVRSEAWAPGRGRIARGSLTALHAAILPGLPPALLSELRAEAQGRCMNEQGAVLALGQRLWPQAATALHRQLDAALSMPASAIDTAMVEQMRSAALLLGAGDSVVPLLWRLPPRPMPELIDDERRAALDLLRLGIASDNGLLELLFRLLLTRTANPASVLDLAFAVELALPPREVDALVARAAAACVAELAPAAPAAAADGRALAAAADDIERTVGWVRSLEAGPVRLAIDRAALREIRGKAVRGITATLAAGMADTLPARFARLAQAAPAPDSAMAELEEAAHAVRRIGLAGRDLGLGETVERILAQARPGFVGGSGGANAVDRARIVEILFGPDAAMAVLRPTAGPAGK